MASILQNLAAGNGSDGVVSKNNLNKTSHIEYIYQI